MKLNYLYFYFITWYELNIKERWTNVKTFFNISKVFYSNLAVVKLYITSVYIHTYVLVFNFDKHRKY